MVNKIFWSCMHGVADSCVTFYGAGPGPDDSYVDVRSNFTTNEVAVDYNAGFTGVLAALKESHNSWANCQTSGYTRQANG